MKKLLCILGAVCFLLCGCNAEGSLMEKIQKRLNEMESYKAKATLTRITNKGENTYEIEQFSVVGGEYKLVICSPEPLKGNYTVYDGEKICQYSASAGGRVISDVPESQARNELFLGSFVKNYMSSEGVSVDVAVMDESKCTVLEAVIPGDNKYMTSEKLWIDNETLDPVRLSIYDFEGKERYIIDYNDFEYNCGFEEGTFEINR